MQVPAKLMDFNKFHPGTIKILSMASDCYYLKSILSAG
jgi:hypothetical protein